MLRNRIVTTALGATLAGSAILCACRGDETKVKLADCPAAVRKTLELEAKRAKVDTVQKLSEDGATTYQASVVLAGKTYQIRIDGKGLLEHLALDVGDDEVEFKACPTGVQTTLRGESHQAKFDTVSRELRYGVAVYAAVARIGGKEYSLVVAQNGTLIEKMLVIADDDIELSQCPTAVQNALKEHARGGKIGVITRSTGVSGHVFEAELEIEGQSYVVELTEGGGLISKSRLEDEDEDEPEPQPALPRSR